MDIAITGSTGLIGNALRTELVRHGHRVVRVVRPQTGPPPDESIAWDPTRGTIDAAGLEGIDAIVHLAGAGIGDRRWTEERKREILRSRVDGTGLLACTVARLSRPPKVFVVGSATGYYGDGGDRELTEEAPAGAGFRAEVCVAWEKAARSAADAGVRTVLLRSANVLTTDGGLLPFLLTPFKLGLGARFGDGSQWFPWITLDDEIAVIRAVLDDATLAGPVNATLAGPVNAAAPGVVTNRGFAKTLGRVLRRPAPWFAPAPVLELIAGRERAREALLSSAKVVPAKLRDAGFAFAEPDLERALRRILTAPAERVKAA